MYYVAIIYYNLPISQLRADMSIKLRCCNPGIYIHYACCYKFGFLGPPLLNLAGVRGQSERNYLNICKVWRTSCYACEICFEHESQQEQFSK